MPQVIATRYTYDDLAQFPDDNLRREIINGELIVSPSPGESHQRILMRLSVRIGQVVESSHAGMLYPAPFDVVFSKFDVVEPDLLFIAREHLQDRITAANIQGPPDLAIEILSPSTAKRDATVKWELYSQYGVAEYWVVDPKKQTITVFRQTAEGGFSQTGGKRYTVNDILRTPLVPALALPLSKIFGDLPSRPNA